MTQTIRAVYENGILRPLENVTLQEKEEVRVTIESPERATDVAPAGREDPLAGLRVRTGIPDLAEHFDDYRFGRRQP